VTTILRKRRCAMAGAWGSRMLATPHTMATTVPTEWFRASLLASHWNSTVGEQIRRQHESEAGRNQLRQ